MIEPVTVAGVATLTGDAVVVFMDMPMFGPFFQEQGSGFLCQVMADIIKFCPG